MDLSQPKGGSINDGIDKESFKVQYSHFDDPTDLIFKMGTNCLMSKIDIQHAFRLLHVKKSQWHLLSIQWLQKLSTLDYHLDYALHPRSSTILPTSYAG